MTVLERAPRTERGGNSAFTAGAMRVTYDGPADLQRLMPDLQAGVVFRYETRAMTLTQQNGRMTGVQMRTRDGVTQVIPADAVVLASGGFEANAEWRTRYLGPGWDLAKVRGTRFNTGDGIRMALEVGALARGNWSGCHAVGWDRNAPNFGDRKLATASRSTVTRSGSW